MDDSADPHVALMQARAVLDAENFDATSARAAVVQLKGLAPPQVAPLVHSAEMAVLASINRRGKAYKDLARVALTKLIGAMEQAHLRVVD